MPNPLQIKPGVRLNGISSEALHALAVATEVISSHSLIPTLTSALDGTHREDSLHYTGYAIDLRSPTHESYALPYEGALRLAQVIVDKLKQRLGPNYDVLHHGPILHFHIEYDPK